MTYKQIPVIYDGDMGGDDLWAIAMLLAHRDRFDILGFASVYGNVSQPFATRNVQNFLHFMGEDSFRVMQGADTPCDGMRPFGDDAYGADGVGGVMLPQSPFESKMGDIADWYLERLNSAKEPVTFFATGPATNIALFIQKYPQKLAKIREIIFMGGAIAPPGGKGTPFIMENGQPRVGNITPYAEFNAYQDPKALNILIQSGITIAFMAADASQFMELTPERQAVIRALHPVYGDAFHRMIMVVATLDQEKFGSVGPFIHDPNVITYALRPDLYKSRELKNLRFEERAPEDEHRGQAITDGNAAPVTWLCGIENTDDVFNLMVESLKTAIARAG